MELNTGFSYNENLVLGTFKTSSSSNTKFVTTLVLKLVTSTVVVLIGLCFFLKNWKHRRALINL